MAFGILEVKMIQTHYKVWYETIILVSTRPAGIWPIFDSRQDKYGQILASF